MDYVNLGRSGLQVSRICLGCMSYGTPEWRDWVLPEEESRPFIRRALEAGINFFDTADMYSNGVSEQVVGRALADFARRDEVVIATKVYFPTAKHPNARGLSKKHVLEAIDASLERLGTDHVDLYQIHRWDDETPIEETLDALDTVVRSGRARYLGASSMFAWQLAKALHRADARGWARFVSMQPHYNLLYREEEREMLPLCRDEGLGVIPWSPLARGLLTGTRRPSDLAADRAEGATARTKSDDYAHRLYYRPGDDEIVSRVVELAHRRGATPAQVSLAWLLRQDGVTAPIVGATQLAHLEEAIESLDLDLDDAEAARLEEPYQPHPVLGHG
jgi:aryl-alcohol dehydrogenase (NADP+)